MKTEAVLQRVLDDARLPHHCALVEGIANYFEPADSWEIGGATADRRSVYFALSKARQRGNEPTNYAVEILMNPFGDKDKCPDSIDGI